MIPKFRIFDKNLKLRLDVHVIDFYEGTIDCYVDDLGVNRQEIYSYEMDEDNYVLMQSTGLRDKNGREIFEGDILNHPLQGMRKVYYPFTDRVASYGLENIENGMRNTLQDAHRLYEVIGNIHEHPELLENI